MAKISKIKKILLLGIIASLGGIASYITFIGSGTKKEIPMEEKLVNTSEQESLKFKANEIADINDTLLAEIAAEVSGNLEYAVLGC